MASNKNEAHKLIIECLTQAAVLLLQNTPIDNITITDLCNKAGVSRISFYRNYDTIEDIFLQHLNSLTDEWWNEYTKKDPSLIGGTFFSELSEQYLIHKDFIKLLYSRGLSHIVKEHIFSRCGPKDEYDITKKYASSVIAGAIYGYLDEWFQNDMGEPPFELNMMVALNLYNLMIQNGKK